VLVCKRHNEQEWQPGDLAPDTAAAADPGPSATAST
jgi:hypothetical protein